MMFDRLPKKPQFRKLQKNLIHFVEQGISCFEAFIVTNFDASSTCCKGMKSLDYRTGGRIYGPLNWEYITVMFMGISFASLNILSKVFSSSPCFTFIFFYS